MKKFLTLFAALALVTAAFATSKTVYFVNSDNWTGTLKCYLYGSGDGNNNNWPGAEMTEAGTLSGYTVYSYTFDDDSKTTCIFNNKVGDSGIQTISFEIENGRYYYNSFYNKMYIKGDWASWGHNTMTEIAKNIWAVTLNMTAGAKNFKFSATTDWSGDSYGKGSALSFNSKEIQYLNGDNTSFTVSEAARYWFILDLSAGQENGKGEIATPYNVSYDKNGGTGVAPSDGDEYYHDYKVAVAKSHSLTAPDGYYFGGWNTSATGNGNNFAVGASLTDVTSSLTLYANWQPYRIVTYDANGGTGEVPDDPTRYEEGQSATVENHGSLKKIGYRFTGWNTTAEGDGDPYAEGASLTIGAASVTLYAQWEEGREYYVTFNNSGENYWGTAYAYTWTNEVHQLGSFPGTQANYIAVGDLYHIHFFTNTKPEWIKWNDGGSNEMDNQHFGNNMKYTRVGGSISHSFNLTADVWASFCPSLDVTVPDGVAVYKGAVSGSNVILTLVETTKIKAGEGVILKAEATGNYVFTYTDVAAGAIADNELSGTDVRIPRNTTKVTYALYDDGGTQIFKKYEGDYIPANRAYFELNSPVGAPAAFRLVEGENGATNIEAIEDAEKAVKFVENGKLYILHEGVVYDATGRIVR